MNAGELGVLNRMAGRFEPGRSQSHRRLFSGWAADVAMVKIDPSEFSVLAEAVVVWTGWGKSAAPRRDESALVRKFGPERASRLLSRVRSLELEFYLSDAWKIAGNLKEMGDMASEGFKSKYPEAPDDLVRALAWCYTFDNK